MGELRSEADELFRRLAARGSFQIRPSARYVPAGTETDEAGREWKTSRPEFVLSLRWWPRGQDGNPFCQRGFAGTTLLEVLREAVKVTAPPWEDIDTLAWRRAEHERKREGDYCPGCKGPHRPLVIRIAG